MGKSPFTDAMEALEEIRDFCKKRQESYEGWDPTPQSSKFDLRRILEKAEEAIETLKPGNAQSSPRPQPPLEVINEDCDKKNAIKRYRGTFD